MIAAIVGVVTARPWILAVAAAIAWGAVQKHRASEAGARAVAAEKALAQLQADAAQMALQTAARTAARHQEIAHVAQDKAARDRADAAAAGAAVRRMLDRAQAGAGGAACAAAAAGGASASADAFVPADVLRRVAEAAGELAAIADERRTAGLACQQSYDILTKP